MANYVSNVTIPTDGGSTASYDIRELFPHVGNCTDAAATAAKTVTIGNFKLYTGAWVVVKFSNTNSADVASLTLNVDSTGAKPIKYRNANLSSAGLLIANRYTYFIYDGTNYQIVGDFDTDTKVTQTNTTTSADYRVLLSGNANDTTETTTGRKSTNLKFNPNTGVLSASSGVTTKTITRSALKGMLTGSGTAAQDKGSGVSPRYFPAKWTFNTGLTATNGDVFIIKLPTAGHSYGVFLSIDNGANYYPISVNGTSKLTTHYGNGYSIAVMFKSDGSTADVFPLAGGNSRSTVTGGCWQVLNYYDSGNSNTYDRNRYNANIKAGSSALVAGNIIVGKDGVFNHLKSGGAFDISYPILYLNAAVAASATTTDTYDILHITITTTQSITLTAYKPVFIKGTLSGTIFTPVSATPLTQTVPTTDDGYVYIYLGNATSTTTMYLQERHPIYAYKNGAFGEITNYSANAGSVAWDNVTGKPSTYTPASGSDYYVKNLTGSSRSTATTKSWVSMCNSTQTGAPTLPTSGKWWHVLSLDCWNSAPNNWVSQLALPTQDDSSIYYRKNPSSGTSIESGTWIKVLDSNNYTSYTVKKDGTGATGSWGISITGNAATATKATQDGDGNTISSTYLKLSGGTMTGDITFTGVGTSSYPSKSKGIYWSGGTDAIDMYYNLRASDAGELIINMRDDSNVRISFAYNGTVKSYIDTNGTYNGNAATSSSWATARTLTLGGQLTGSVSVKGDANMTLNGYLKNGLICDESEDFASYAWHKFAEVTITEDNADRSITFIVSKTWGDVPRCSGILTAHVRTNSTKIHDSSQFYWQLANIDINPEDFVFVYTNTANTSCKIELWYKQTSRWDGWVFSVLKEHNRVSKNNAWTLYTSTGHGSASHTTGTDSYASSIADIKNSTSGTSSNVTGTVAIAHGGTGATNRLAALRALTEQNVGTNAQYFLTITQNWGEGGYTSVANAKTVLGLKSAAYTESSEYAPSSHTHGNITSGGALQTTDITIASGDKLVVTDSSNSNKVARASISFDGSTTSKCLTQKGTWETPPDTKNTAGSTDTSSKIFLIGATSQATNPQTYSDDQCYVTSGTLQANKVQASVTVCANTANSTSAGGVALYSTDPEVYGIMFRGTSNSGKHGYVQSDWATYFTMNQGATTRGWIFRKKTDGPVASISGAGNAVFNGSVTVGGNTTNTSGCRMEYNTSTQSLDFVFA